jgi:hypothetical protein
MQNRLSILDDPTAIALLLAMATPKLRDDTLQAELTPGLRLALADAFGGIPAESASEGDLARRTLLFLARDPALHPILTAFLDGPQALTFSKAAPKQTTAGKTITVAIAVLLLLQTHLHIERDAAGKWNLLLDKPTASDQLLEPIVQRLLALPPGK